MSLALNKTRKLIYNEKLNFLIGLAALMAFNIVFAFFYENHLFTRWNYFGFRFANDNKLPYWSGVACTLVVYLFLPKRAKAASDYVHWLLFVIAFVPIQLTIGLANSVPGGVGKYQFALLLSFILSLTIANSMRKIAWAGKIVARRSIRSTRENRTDFLLIFFLAAIAVAAFLILRFYSIIQFSGFDEIYAQRERASDFGIGVFEGYLILWATYLLAPLTMAIGLSTGERKYLIGAIALWMIVFMITAAKVAFVIFFFGLTIHFFNKIDLQNRMHMLLAIPILPILLSISLDMSTESPIGTVIVYTLDQIVVRGIAIQAMIFNLYLEFFNNNPHTYYSHVTGISLLIDYPYDLPVGRVISTYQYGHPDTNANSGIWSTDGVAAAGAPGIFIVGALLGIFLGFTDRLSRNVDMAFLSLATIPLAFLMANVSLFTTLASGGGLILVMLIPLIWRELRVVSVHSNPSRFP